MLVEIGALGLSCTMEAKICPDGSAVGRVGPNCEFDLCPGERNGEIVRAGSGPGSKSGDGDSTTQWANGWNTVGIGVGVVALLLLTRR